MVVQGLSMTSTALKALQGIAFDLGIAEIVDLVSPDGAGEATTMCSPLAWQWSFRAR
jgi:ABC-type branched-subunit amino acid transport system ATPase component